MEVLRSLDYTRLTVTIVYHTSSVTARRVAASFRLSYDFSVRDGPDMPVVESKSAVEHKVRHRIVHRVERLCVQSDKSCFS